MIEAFSHEAIVKDVKSRGQYSSRLTLPRSYRRQGGQEEGESERRFTGEKTRAGGTALRASERGTDPETQTPPRQVVLVFLDRRLALSPAGGRRPPALRRDPAIFVSFVLFVTFVLTVGACGGTTEGRNYLAPFLSFSCGILSAEAVEWSGGVVGGGESACAAAKAAALARTPARAGDSTP